MVESRSARAGSNAAVHPARTGLEDYVRRMPEAQKTIYYVNAASLAAAQASPHLEGFTRRGFEVLFLTDPVDEWVAQHFTEFDGRKLVSVAKGAEDLGSADEKKELEEQAKAMGGFLGFAKEALGAGIKEVRLTNRLTDSPCCLVGDEHGVSPQMEALMKRMGQEVPPTQRILELNPRHPLVQKLTSLHGKAPEDQLKAHVETLRDQAAIAEGGTVTDTAGFAKRVQALLLGAMGA